jgi:predicted nucleic acid-binding protein
LKSQDDQNSGGPFHQRTLKKYPKQLDEYADFVKVQTKVDVCRDPKDNFLLSLSIDGNAGFLLTGDKDLLELAKFGETEIITISDFLQKK